MSAPVMRWRVPLLGLLLFAASACEDAPTTGGPIYPPILAGGDVSALTRLEAAGASYRLNGATTDAITALRLTGSNLFRLRIFVNPDGSEVQVNTLAYTVALAQRVKASGAELLLDFHYSDTWADPGKQFTPAAWAALDIDALAAQVQSYTTAVLDTLRAAGVVPRIVQVGNEIDGGLLWPLGKMGGAGYNDAAAFARFGRLLRAGVLGVRAGTQPRDSVAVMLHYSGGGNPEGMQWFFDIVQVQGVEYDYIGLSFYPWWHGSLLRLQQSLMVAATRYRKKLMVVETAYPWRGGFGPDGANTVFLAWPQTPEGQRTFLSDVIRTVQEAPNGLGRGVLWWYPESVAVPGFPVWEGGTLALFDASGEVLPAAREFNTLNQKTRLSPWALAFSAGNSAGNSASARSTSPSLFTSPNDICTASR